MHVRASQQNNARDRLRVDRDLRVQGSPRDDPWRAGLRDRRRRMRRSRRIRSASTRIAATFILIGILRFISMTRFLKSKIGPTDVAAAQRWEVVRNLLRLRLRLHLRPVVHLLVRVRLRLRRPSCSVDDDHRSPAWSASSARNFGLDRMLSIQLWIAVVMVSFGLLLEDGHLPPDPGAAAAADAGVVPVSRQRHAARPARVGACPRRSQPAGGRARYRARHHASRPRHARCRRADRRGQRRSRRGVRPFRLGQLGRPLVRRADRPGLEPRHHSAAFGRRSDAGRQRPAQRQGDPEARQRALQRSHRQLAAGQGRAAVRRHHRARPGRRAHQLHGALRCADGPAQSRLLRPAGGGRSRAPPHPQERTRPRC